MSAGGIPVSQRPRRLYRPFAPLSKHTWLVVAETQGAAHRSEDTIVSASPLDPELFSGPLANLVCTQRQALWDKN